MKGLLQSTSLRPTASPLTDTQRNMYIAIVTKKVIHSYTINDVIVYVCQLSDYVYLHYTIKHGINIVCMAYSISHSFEYISIP